MGAISMTLMKQNPTTRFIWSHGDPYNLSRPICIESKIHSFIQPLRKSTHICLRFRSWRKRKRHACPASRAYTETAPPTPPLPSCMLLQIATVLRCTCCLPWCSSNLTSSSFYAAPHCHTGQHPAQEATKLFHCIIFIPAKNSSQSHQDSEWCT
jgi:hypothetical protein